jgi:hypothetical protein
MSDSPPFAPSALPKVAIGIYGLDEVLSDGFPLGGASLICGASGCGKTLLAMEFLHAGARDLGALGALISFEESKDELATNVASFGYDLDELIAASRRAIAASVPLATSSRRSSSWATTSRPSTASASKASSESPGGSAALTQSAPIAKPSGVTSGTPAYDPTVPDVTCALSVKRGSPRASGMTSGSA